MSNLLNLNQILSIKPFIMKNGYRQCMENYSHIEANSIWTLVPKTKDMHVVSTKWVYKVKYNLDWTVERLIARLVTKRISQQGVILAKLSPVVKLAIVKLLLTLANVFSRKIHQLDVKNAFLHGHLQESIYVSQPPRFPLKLILIMSACCTKPFMVSNMHHELGLIDLVLTFYQKVFSYVLLILHCSHTSLLMELLFSYMLMISWLQVPILHLFHNFLIVWRRNLV